ncbi:nucleotidyltransferase domain-containing protein [Nocardia harenae]|uniref:nucleotidyltransferase domain-containing protein n=1 Tax=Nocardia harenae TaxID=358707 RepID=UPI00082AEE74|nr:nucleotidyltransferase domain-containing protein [Nocardia harenae]
MNQPPPIAGRTVELAQQLFGGNLLAAYVGGSYARGANKPTSDVDTVVILRQAHRAREADFAEQFRELHRTAGLKYEHCGEVFDLPTLEGLLTYTERCLEAVPAIQQSACYLADCPLSIFRKGDVVWKMLEEPKICVFDPDSILDGLTERAQRYFTRWPMPRIQTYKGRLRLPDGSRHALLAHSFAALANTSQWAHTPVGIGLERWFGRDLIWRSEALVGQAPVTDPTQNPAACPLPEAGRDLAALLAAQCLATPMADAVRGLR